MAHFLRLFSRQGGSLSSPASGADEAGVFHKKIVAFLTDFSMVDRIINHLKLTFVADKAPPPQGAFQEYLLAADPPVKYFS